MNTESRIDALKNLLEGLRPKAATIDRQRQMAGETEAAHYAMTCIKNAIRDAGDMLDTSINLNTQITDNEKVGQERTA